MTQYKSSILIIDDESGILDTLGILLKNSGFEVETAQGGRAGLETMKSSAFSLYSWFVGEISDFISLP